MSEQDLPETASMVEIATLESGKDITRGYIDPMMPLSPQDTVLQARGRGDYAQYELILQDDQVASTFQQRRLAVVSREWTVDPGASDKASQMAADYLRETLDHIQFDWITDRMLYGVFYGFAIAECLWGRDGAKIALEAIKVRKQRRFRFGMDGRPRLITTDDPMVGMPLPERKFWHFTAGADNNDEPYGLGLAHALYWPVYFKRAAIKSWSVALDRFGAPTVKGVFPKAATEAEKKQLHKAVQSVHAKGAIIIPEGMQVELLMAGSTGQVSFTDMTDRMNDAISKVVLSQTMTTDVAGGQYKGEVQKSVRNEVVQSDADLVCHSFSQSVGRWLTEWNFPGAAVPQVWRVVDEPEDLVQRANRDKVVFDMGFRPSLAYIKETYGEGWEAATAPAATPIPSKETQNFTEVYDEDDTVLPLIEQTLARLNPVLEEMLAPVIATLDQVATLADFKDRLPGLIRKMGITPLTRLTQQACLEANLRGRSEVLDEDREKVVNDWLSSHQFADPQAVWGGLPFNEAIDFFRDKVNLPTEKWDDLKGEMHAKAFVSAGAMRDDLLADLHTAVDAAMTEGITLQDFRKRFDQAVAEYGWDYKGTRNWRSRLIFETNIRTAYAAGRYKQMTDPELLKRRPYWQYKHSGSSHPRPAHKARDGMILLASDSWWQANYPPNGFGCKCRVITLAERDLKRMGRTGPDQAPEQNAADTGWDYNVGVAAYGDRVAAKAMQAWQEQESKWEPLLTGDWKSYDRPEKIPVARTGIPRGKPATDATEMASLIKEAIGGEKAIFSLEANDGFVYPVELNAAALAEHLNPDRAPFLPWLTQTVESPFEVWLQFMRHKESRKVVLRTRFIRGIDDGSGKGYILVLQASRGVLESWTALTVRSWAYVQKQRTGSLIFGR
ncbi:MAG: DUF935 family protein [Nitrospirae bacterium]|nr:DUF935 family protein [Magnetococcales bacterium]HAT50757.1 hypothetical protein [Alphaproteobacteria bacterium]